MQSDLKQATRFEALSVVHMNVLLLIKGKELKPNNFMMVSTVLPPIQRASITPLLTSHQSRLLHVQADHSLVYVTSFSQVVIPL